MVVGVSSPTCVSATRDPSGRRVCPTTSEMLTTKKTSSYDYLSRPYRTDTENYLRPEETTGSLAVGVVVVVVPAQVVEVMAVVEIIVDQMAVVVEITAGLAAMEA